MVKIASKFNLLPTKVAADALGNVSDALGNIVDALVYIAEGVGNNFCRLL